MAEKKLSIKLSAKDRLSKALRTAGDATRKTGSALVSMAKKGSQAIEGLTRKLFFLKEAVNVVAQAARGLWDMFITPAINARKLAVSLTNVFGGGTAQQIRKFSKETGLSFEVVSKAALDMEQKLEKAGGLAAYLAALERVNKWRPDLGAEGAVAFVNDLVNKVTEATEGSSKQLGRFTSVVVGGVAGQAVDLNKELDKMGVFAKAVDPATTALDRLRAAWAEFAANVGGKVLDKLAEGAMTLLDWLTKNEEKVLRLTEAFTDLINQGIQKLIDWVDSGGIDVLIERFKEWWQIIKDIWTAIQPVVNAVGRFIGQAGQGAAQRGAPKTAGQAVGQAVTPGGFGQAASNLRLLAATGAAGLGLGVQRTFGFTGAFKGRNLAKDFGESVLNVPTAAERNAVDVRVTVDDEGALKAFVAKDNARRNADIFDGAGGGNNPQPSFAWR